MAYVNISPKVIPMIVNNIQRCPFCLSEIHERKYVTDNPNEFYDTWVSYRTCDCDEYRRANEILEQLETEQEKLCYEIRRLAVNERTKVLETLTNEISEVYRLHASAKFGFKVKNPLYHEANMIINLLQLKYYE